MVTNMPSRDEWALDLVDDDLELPGWLFVPQGMGMDDQERWVSDALADIVGTPGWDERPVSEEDARELLASAIAQRAASDSLAMLQVWPALGPEAAMCHIDILPSDGLPDWAATDAVVHPVESPHIGPGLQCSTLRTVQIDDDVHLDVSGVHFIFDNGDVTLMFSLDETVALLTSIAMPAFVLLMRNIRMVRGSDGAVFESVPPRGVVVEPEWPIEETA